MFAAQSPPPLGTRARVWFAVLRILAVLVALASLGMLAWLSLLLPTLVRRTVRDWVLFGSAVAATIGGIVVIDVLDGRWQGIGSAVLIGEALIVSAYVATVGLTRRQARWPAGRYDRRLPWPGYLPAATGGSVPGLPLPSLPRPDRVEQVRAGLDELSAYLKQQDRP